MCALFVIVKTEQPELKFLRILIQRIPGHEILSGDPVLDPLSKDPRTYFRRIPGTCWFPLSGVSGSKVRTHKRAVPGLPRITNRFWGLLVGLGHALRQASPARSDTNRRLPMQLDATLSAEDP